jgi:hypothetical protein
MARTKTRFADDEIVTSVIAFADCYDTTRGFVSVAVGQRLRADNPIVKRHPDWFVSDGADSLAITRARQAIETADLKPAPADPMPTRIVKAIPDRSAVVCIRGRQAGERAHRNADVVKRSPGDWVPVIPDPNLERRDALVALETIIETREEGTRTLHKGQWCRRDDPFVLMHPTMFALPQLEED